MQYTTRFSKIEDVILIDENFTPEYKEIQSWLKSYFSYSMFKSNKHGLFNSDTFDCLSFEHINRTDKDRFKYQISPVRIEQETNRALVVAFDKPYFIQKINENSFDCYTTIPNTSYSADGDRLWDIGTFNLKYSEYEIVYCIINKLVKFEIFKDKEEFETVYNFCKTLFDGTEKDFLTCLIHPYKLDGYKPYPNDYNKIEHYADLKTCLLEIKNSLANKPAPTADNLDAFLEIMTKIELADIEVNWQHFYRYIIDFSHIEMSSLEYKEGKNKKIKIKSLVGFDSDFGNKIKPIIENIEKYEFKRLSIEAKKNYLNNLVKSQKIVIDCMEQVQKLQDAFDADTKSRKMYSNSVQQTRYFTYALFKEKLSEPMHMNLPYYNDENVTRNFKNGNETVYNTQVFLRNIFGNLESRRDCIGNLIHELLKAFNLPSFEYVLPLNELPEVPALLATEKPTNTKELDNTTLIQKINGDSYKELLNDSLVIELIDCEVNWIDYYKEINAFCNITKEEYDYWKDKKILIKDVLNKHDTFQKYYNHLQDLAFDIINEIDCQELNITDNTLQNLKKRREKLNSITNSF